MKIIYKLYYYGKNYLKKLYFNFFKIPTLKQEMLFRLALKEKGINPNKIKIECNHNLGLNYANGIEFGIKYPDSFFINSVQLIPREKKISFYFNGNMSSEGEREKLLKPFRDLPDSLIIDSDDGRVIKNKDKFNTNYFEPFANSKFGLCPHQLNWDGNLDELWTYRFIESCFVESIPILFRKTPLSVKFVSGFFTLWDDEVLELIKNNTELDFREKAKENLSLAKQKFCLTDDDIKEINRTLKK